MRIQYETHLKVEIFFFTPVCASLTWLSKLNGALIHNNPFFNFFLRKMSIAYNCIVFWGIIFMHKSHVIVINTSFAEVKYNASGKLKKKNQHFEIVFESFFFKYTQIFASTLYFSSLFLDRTVTERVDGS